MVWLLICVASGLSALCSVALVNRYLSLKLHKNTFPFTLALLIVNLWLLLSITYLLPLDVFLAAVAQNQNPENGDSFTRREGADGLSGLQSMDRPTNLAGVWYAIYWTEFVICWFVMPVLMSYLDLKYLFPYIGETGWTATQGARIKKALFTNIKFYALCGIAFVIGALYLFFAMHRGASDLKPLLISLSHLYSLSYTLVLLAMGLILLPKAFFLGNNSENAMFVELSKINDDLNDARLALTDYAEKILSLPEVRNGDVVLGQAQNECKIEVQGLVNELKITIPQLSQGGGQPNVSLDKINKFYNFFLTEYYNYLYYEDQSDVIIHRLTHSQNKSLHVSKSILNFCLGGLCAAMSLMVALLELTPSKYAHAWIFKGHSWWNFLLEISILVYNTIASLHAMSCFKFQNFHIIPTGHSNPKNSLYFSLYSSRLLLPLCFNFMALLPEAMKGHESSFESVLYKDLKLIPLVDMLNRYLPIFFLVLVPLIYFFDLKRKLLVRVLGEDFYYELFGALYDPITPYDQESHGRSDLAPSTTRSRHSEDYEYSLQDGRFLFQRATSKYGMREADNTEEHTYV
ncbi:LAMI_0G11452g1_1 [Lachancea mirantina]|uniref:LAMI_0G11452g1_1 n=1 Tax=Lachancea mirantina TaxID=1230905 RepID=A0A1G4KAZ5_9SACH|nr:LAMI_0G11452g1_1 [Lachancea mirantina]